MQGKDEEGVPDVQQTRNVLCLVGVQGDGNTVSHCGGAVVS